MQSPHKLRTIRANQNDHIFTRLRYSVAASLLVAVAIVAFIGEEVDPTLSLIWLGLTLAVAGYRFHSAIAYARDPHAHARWRHWHSRFQAGSFAAAFLWAVAPWLLFPESSPTHEVLLVLGIAGVGGGAIATLSYDRETLTLYLLTLMVGTVSRLLMAQTTLAFQLALLVTLYFMFLIKGGLDIGASYLEMLRLKEDARENDMALLSTAERMARIGYWRWDMHSETLEISRNLALMCGRETDRVTFDECLQLVHPDDRRRVAETIETVINTGTEATVEYRLRREGDADWVIMNQIVTLYTNSNGEESLMGTVQDISMIKSAEQKIFSMAYYDELTGLANRGHLHQHLAEQIKHARRTGGHLALLYLDLDNFKSINDTLGHAMGDRFLQAFATMLREVLREDDFLARLGGDEFCIVIQDVQDGVTPAWAAQRCLSLGRQAVLLDGHEILPAMSIGIATFPQDGDDADSLLRAADTAMYAAKRKGKHGFAFYDRRLTEEATRRMQLESDLRRAVGGDQFRLVYQPKVTTADGRIAGVEALIRWEHPERGLVPPGEFIDTAERIGLINDIGDWVLETACRQLRQWQRLGLNLQMAINISSSHFGSPDFVEKVIEARRRHELPEGSLEIEITESVSRDPRLHIRNCEVLHQHGIHVAIDDFGTGYSSLSVLQQLHIDTIKIDRSFVQDLPEQESARLMIQTIVAMARGLNFEVVAEGVETEEQARFLCDCQVDWLQGYLFSRPVEAEEIPSLVYRFASGSEDTLHLPATGRA